MALLGSLGFGAVLTAKDQMSGTFNRVNQSFVRLHKQADTSLKGVEERIEALQNKMDRARKGMRGSMIMMGIGGAVALPFVMATRGAIKFEDQLGKLKGLLAGKGIFGEEAIKQTAEFGEMIKNVANNSRQDLEMITTASYDVVSGLENMASVAPVLQRVADLATSANGSIESSSEAVITSMNTFGVRWGDTMTEAEKADRIFITLTNVVGRYKTNLNDLSAGMKFATPVANIMGQSFEGTAASIGLLQTKGLGAQMAGTAYAASMRGLIMLTTKFKDKTLQAKSASMDMDEFLQTFEGAQKTGGIEKIQNPLAGLKFRDESGRMMEIWEIVADMERVFGISEEAAAELGNQVKDGALSGADAFKQLGLSVADVTAMQEVMGDEGMRGWALWLGQSEALREVAEAAGNMAAAQEALNNAQDTTAGKLSMLKNRISTLSDTIGSALTPTVERITDSLLGLMDSANMFITLHPDAAKWIGWGGLITGALLVVGGAVGTLIFGIQMLQAQMAMMTLVGGGKALVGFGIAAKFAAAGTWLFSAALWANPITWIVAGVIALVAGIVLLITHWDWVKEVAGDVLGWLGRRVTWFENLFRAMGVVIKQVWDKFGWIVKTSPAYILIKGMIDSMKWLLRTMGLIGGPEIVARPGTLDPTLLTPTKLAATGGPTAGEEIRNVAAGPTTGPGMPEAGVSPNQIFTTNHFHVAGDKKSAKELAREVTKRQMQMQMRTVQGVN